MRYTFPFMFISAVFWLLHTWILDPLPNQFRRREFIRYRWARASLGGAAWAA
jgi:cell division protease FtsH